METTRLTAEGQQPAAIGWWLRSISRSRQLDPLRDFVGGGVDDGNAGCVLIVGKDAASVGRDGDALNCFCDGNRGDEAACLEIQDADATRADVGSVGAAAVGRKNEHVRLRLARRDFRKNFASGRIDDLDGVGKLGGDVEQAVGTKFRAMGTKRFAELDAGNELAVL